ncbi:MAG: response regulator transcription factor [Saprospiraceae bacterium]|nr:response regulator transcription factor [Saprospiraceae bacterium]
MNKSIKIVLAEDSTLFAALLKFRLEKEGYKLFIASDGKKAIELITEHQPDIILTDIMMPFLSGLEVTSYVRQTLKMTVPVIVFSAAGQEKMVMEAFNLGATDFMGKPFNPNELIIRIKKATISIPALN